MKSLRQMTPPNLRQLQRNKPEPPFDESDDIWGHKVIEWLKKHGPSIAKLLLMVATGCATAFGGWKAATSPPMDILGINVGGDPSGQPNYLVAFMVWGCGFILEIMYAYSWMKKGHESIAGDQVQIIDTIHNVTSTLMVGALVCMLLEAQAGLHILFIFWTSLVEPIGAVWLLHQLFVLKGSHPIEMQIQKGQDMIAEFEAEKMKEERAKLDHAIKGAKLERSKESRELTITGQEIARWMASKRYRRMIRRETENEIFNREGADVIDITPGDNWFKKAKKMLAGRKN